MTSAKAPSRSLKCEQNGENLHDKDPPFSCYLEKYTCLNTFLHGGTISWLQTDGPPVEAIDSADSKDVHSLRWPPIEGHMVWIGGETHRNHWLVTLVSPILRSIGTMANLFPKMYRGRICNIVGW